MAVFGWLSKSVSIGTLQIPVWALIECGALLLSFVIYFTSHPKRAPIYWSIFVLWAFVMSILWIYVFAHELINFLSVPKTKKQQNNIKMFQLTLILTYS
jgi:hypothetical protein